MLLLPNEVKWGRHIEKGNTLQNQQVSDFFRRNHTKFASADADQVKTGQSSLEPTTPSFPKPSRAACQAQNYGSAWREREVIYLPQCPWLCFAPLPLQPLDQPASPESHHTAQPPPPGYLPPVADGESCTEFQAPV